MNPDRISMLFRKQFLHITSTAEVSAVACSTTKSDVASLTQPGIMVEVTEVTPKTFYSQESAAFAYQL